MLYILIIYAISLVIIFTAIHYNDEFKKGVVYIKNKFRFYVLAILFAPIIAIGIICMFLEKNTN